MRLWFSRVAGVSIRDQLATQLILAIASGDLPPGKRLPSTRAIARQYELHPNTVSSVYRQLEQEHWITSKPGSGVFVGAEGPQRHDSTSNEFDALLATLLETVRTAGFTAASLRERLDVQLANKPRSFVFVDPDEDLREVVCHELRSVVTWNVEHTPLNLPILEPLLSDSIFLARPSKRAELRAILPTSAFQVCLHIRSVESSLARYLPLQEHGLAFVASSWPPFLDTAKTVLIASGIHPDGILLRNAKDAEWIRGAEVASAIVCDSKTADAVPAHIPKIVFRLIAEDSIAVLKSWERFYLP